MLEKGIVIKSTGKWYIVAMPDGSLVNCRIRGKLRLDGLRTTNPISVGDVVHISEEIDGEGNRMIEDFDPRRNYIVRKSTNLSKQKQIIAANIDRAYLIVTLKSPVTHLAFIDRFLVSAESFRIPTTLLFNKVDLLDADEMEYLEALRFMYHECGYPSEVISARHGKNLDFLRKEIKDRQVVISGHSGVGKSTLINALDPNLDVKTGAISNAHQQGQHTTTFAEMHRLESGGYIIDTPGIRAFGIVDLDKAVISHYFPEMRERMHACKFNNCLHINEPKCAIKEAVESGEIFESRYATYLQLLEEDEGEVHRKNPFA
ncbi:MAG: ribosome small subunit-dependent GTPase A [Crocinitomicaceae bacterium]